MDSHNDFVELTINPETDLTVGSEMLDFVTDSEQLIVKQSIYDVLGANDQELARRQYHDEDGDYDDVPAMIVNRQRLVPSTGGEEDDGGEIDDRDIDEEEDEDNIKNSSTGSSPANRRSVEETTPYHSLTRDRQSQIDAVTPNDIHNDGSMSIDSGSILCQQQSQKNHQQAIQHVQNHFQRDKLDSSFGSVASEEPEQLRKLFIGGLDYKTSESTLRNHFGNFGEVVDCVVMREPQTKRSRGFGFVIYANSSMVDKAQAARPHEIDGRPVQSKRAISREDSGKPEAQATVKKVYLGGLSDDVEESELRDYFQNFGNIVNINIVAHKDTGKRRGFAFIEYDDYDPVDKIVLQKFHTIKDKRVEAKKAIPKVEMDARKRGDPRSVMTSAMMTLGTPLDASGSSRPRAVRGASGLWNGAYGGGYLSPYSNQAELDGYPPHYGYPASAHHGANGWMLHGLGTNQLGGPCTNFRHGSSVPYPTRGNYSAQSGRWSDYVSFPNSVTGPIGPMRGHGSGTGTGAYQHRRFDPYGCGYGGPHRGRGYNQ